MRPLYLLRAIMLILALTATPLALADIEHSNRLLPDRSSNFSKHHPHNPLMQFTDFIITSSLYESIMTSPDFIKVQDIAKRLWDNQTGAKRRVSHSKRSH